MFDVPFVVSRLDLRHEATNVRTQLPKAEIVLTEQTQLRWYGSR